MVLQIKIDVLKKNFRLSIQQAVMKKCILLNFFEHLFK